MANKEFNDSAEATDFMETLHGMLNDPRLAAWADVTDENFDTLTEQKLMCAQTSFTAFINEMFEAGE